MRLKQWLADKGRSGAWLGRELGVSRATVSGWVSGTYYPDAPKLAAIAELTDGEVRAADFLPAEAPSMTSGKSPDNAG